MANPVLVFTCLIFGHLWRSAVDGRGRRVKVCRYCGTRKRRGK